MPSKVIRCTGCDKYLGEINKAKIMKGITFLCYSCEIMYSVQKDKSNNKFNVPDIFDIFK